MTVPRPYCCPEPRRCEPIHQLGVTDGTDPGESFICFGRMSEGVTFDYGGNRHANDLRSCHYTPLKGLIANQENADDWRAIQNAYGRALDALETL